MIPLVEWTNLIRSKFSESITIDEAKTMSIEECFEHHEPRHQLGKLPRAYKNLSNQFIEAWNDFHKGEPIVDFNRNMRDRHKYSRHRDNSQEIKITKALRSTDKLFSSCARLKDSSEILYMLHRLGEIQNEFLARVSSSKNCGFIEKKLQSITAANIISYDRDSIWEILAIYCRTNPEFGQGNSIECDWEKIEQELEFTLLRNKAFLVTDIWALDSISEFRFKNEIFREQYRLFDSINDVVPQQDILPNAKQIEQDLVFTEDNFKEKILATLKAMLLVLQHQLRMKITPDMTIEDFIQRVYLDKSSIVFIRALKEKQSPIVDVKLCNIIALYQLIEDMISDTVLGCLDEKYKQEFRDPNLLKRIIETKLMPIFGSLNELDNRLTRFIVRYIGGSNSEEPSTSLWHVLEYIQWPKDKDIIDICNKDEELQNFFEQATIGCGFSILTAIRFMKAASNGDIRPGSANESVTTQATGNGREGQIVPTRKRMGIRKASSSRSGI
jgi:hypothetical protein